MKEWANAEDFFVLRNRKSLQLLQQNLSAAGTAVGGRNSDRLNSRAPNLNLQSSFESRNCLIRVKVSVLQKGCPRRFAIICMPTSEDAEKFRSNRNWSGPVEKLNPDANETARKRSRRSHSALLKRLRRQRTRHRKSLAGKLTKLLATDLIDHRNKSKNLLEISREAVREQSRKMAQLHLPECANVRYFCDREVMGYVTVGDFSFAEAKGIGLGYATLDSLIELINKRYNFVLIRNTQTRQYRVATLEVVT